MTEERRHIMALTPRVWKSENPENNVTDRDGFVGVDPIYQNYGNEVDAPLESKEGERAAERVGGTIVQEQKDPEVPEGLEPVRVFSTTSSSEDEKADADNEGRSSLAAGVSENETGEDKAKRLAAEREAEQAREQGGEQGATPATPSAPATRASTAGKRS